MINLFDVENGVVIPTVHCSTISWLSDIKKKYKENSGKIYAYIFYMSYTGEQNPYYNTREEDRSDILISDLKITENVKDKIIVTAIEKAKELYSTPTSNFYNALKSVIEGLTLYMKNTKIEGGRDGNLEEILKITKDYNNIRKSYKEVYNDLREEESINARGGQELAYDQR